MNSSPPVKIQGLEFKPGIVKILNALIKSEGKTFTELERETGLSPPALSRYLKKLVASGFLEKDLISKKYHIPIGFEIIQKYKECRSGKDWTNFFKKYSPYNLFPLLFSIDVIRSYLISEEPSFEKEALNYIYDSVLFLDGYILLKIKEILNEENVERICQLIKEFANQIIIPVLIYLILTLNIDKERSKRILKHIHEFSFIPSSGNL
jgi:DNA-binding Lrp family transcriptional regulator